MAKIRIGWASRDVSTTAPTCISGQFSVRISRGIMDPVTVTALVIDSDGELLTMVSCDVTEFDPGITRRIRRKIGEKCPWIAPQKVLINATHTHTTIDIFSGMYRAGKDFPPEKELPFEDPENCREFFADAIADALNEAWQTRDIGSYAFGYGFAATGFSRRVCYLREVEKKTIPGMYVDGQTRMYGKTNTPDFSHYEAGVDPLLNTLYTFDLRGNLTGAIVNTPCPSQLSECEWHLSADFWNEFRALAHQEYGEIHILAQCAPAGDLSPRLLHYQQAQKRRLALQYGDDPLAARKDLAQRLFAGFQEILAWAKKDLRDEAPILNRVETLQLTARQVSDEEYREDRDALAEFAKIPFKTDGTALERIVFNSELAAKRNRCQAIVRVYEEQKEHPTVPVEIHVQALGEIAFVSSPFELYMDYMHRIQAQSPFVQTFNIQLTEFDALREDDFRGYLPTKRAEAGAGYSANRYCCRVFSDGGKQLVEGTLRALNEMYDKLKEKSN